MATGMAESVDAAKVMGRGKGEGWLFLTNRSLWHWIDGEPAPWVCFKLNDYQPLNVPHGGGIKKGHRLGIDRPGCCGNVVPIQSGRLYSVWRPPERRYQSPTVADGG
jgi:hypothetical protein